jgi:hypothetical protein
MSCKHKQNEEVLVGPNRLCSIGGDTLLTELERREFDSHMGVFVILFALYTE